MRKVGFILFVIVLSIGCSVSRKQVRKTIETAEISGEINLFEDIIGQNLIGRSFFIEKAEFRIRTEEGEKSGVGTVKFLMPDKFLISIKSRAGIEIARIFIKGDSIMANDRLNKRMYRSSRSYLQNKYGFPVALLPVILGDYVNEEKLDSSKIHCTDGKLLINGSVQDVKIEYLMDCKLGKSMQVIARDNKEENSIKIKYSQFFKTNTINAPGRIEVVEKQSNTTIEIKIVKILSPWEGSIEFIPGKQYETINFL